MQSSFLRSRLALPSKHELVTAQELTPEIEGALRFVKVTLGTGNSGYLSAISCAMLLVELNRRGLFITTGKCDGYDEAKQSNHE
jgi:hypothetical protein